ncbi:MAG: ABC transporter permease subunit [Opitutales bacterium]
MQPVLAVFKREFLGYFRSPVAYVFLVVFLLATVGLTWYIGGFFESNDASLSILFTFLPWIFLFLIPAAGMRLWAEEKKSGTWELLFTLPLSPAQAVLGKFLAAWLFIVLALAGTFPLALTAAYLGDPDWGPIWAGYFGAALMAGAYLGICSLFSSLTSNQVISFVLSVMACLILVFLGWDAFSGLLHALNLPVPLVDGLANFSFITHFEPMSRGLVTLADTLFFLTLTGFCLFLNILVLER